VGDYLEDNEPIVASSRIFFFLFFAIPTDVFGRSVAGITISVARHL
jgi:hypothetical protein